MTESRVLLVGGVDRSGTTMLGAELGAAAGATVVPESQFLIELISRGKDGWRLDEVLDCVAGNWRFGLWGVDIDDVRANLNPRSDAHQSSSTHLADVYATAARLYGRQTDQPWNGLIVDHTPSNCRYALEIQRIIPVAGVVHIVRDGRAVWNSMRSLEWGASTPSLAALFWMRRLTHGLLLELADRTGEPHLDFQVARVRYEDLLDPDSPSGVDSLLSRLGIEERSETSSTNRFQVPAYSARQHDLVHQGANRSRVDAWEALPETEIRRFEQVGGEALELLGYQRRFPSAIGGYPSRWMVEDALRDLWTQQIGGRINTLRRRRKGRR